MGTGGTDLDVAFPEDVRAPSIAAAAHAPGMSMPFCTYPANTMNYSSVLRSLLVAMVD